MSRSNWLWPLLILIVAALWFAQAFGALPPAVADLAARAWPIGLVILGLSALVGRRFRYANLAILILCGALIGGVIVAAYGKQSSKFRQDYHENFSQALPAEVKNIRITVSTLLAQMDVIPADTSTISAGFVGSPVGHVSAAYNVDQGVGVVTISETRTNAIPMLESIGHGKLTLRLPAGVTIDELDIKGGEGNLALDATGIALRNLNVKIGGGNITLTLPTLTPEAALAGSVHTSGGNLLINVPQGLTAKLTIDSGRPDFNASDYLLLSGGVLQTAGTRDFQVVLGVGASGTVSIKP